MTEQKLKQANKLLKDISELENAKRVLHNGHEIAICYYFDSSYGNSEFKKIVSLNEERIEEVKLKVNEKLVKLKEEFENL